MQELDLFVIGAGSGGVRCARIAAQNGARVGIAERRHWGGTCVNLGCVPKKLMVYAAETGRMIEDAPAFGWDVQRPETFDWYSFLAAKDREIERLNGIYISMLEKAGITLYTGDARLIDAHTIEIGPSVLAPDAPVQRVRAKKIVLATGSTPIRLDIPGAELAITSDELFHLPERPQKVAIIGSGYIGVEFAGILAGMGSQVDLFYRQTLPLRGFDGEVRAHLKELIDLYGITQHPGTSPVRLEDVGGGKAVRLILDDGTAHEVDAVIMATGRRAAIDKLGLDSVGVAMEKGHVVAGIDGRTNIPSIYAIGDIRDEYNLTPTAIAEGHMLAEQLFNPQGRTWSFETLPKAVFFSSPIGVVGLSEEEAAQKHDLAIYTSTFTPMRQTLPKRAGKVLMKLVVDRQSDIVLGAHMVGPDAPEIIQMLAIAVTAKLTKKQLDQTIALHPSTAEEFVTMRTPTRMVDKQ
ncbi:glutathione-disulfide reductase [Bombella saccharophila]|uniref:Glutathione-disulfide reductase n=1 Tax=Bombella saccharophila TaxID=2967338 RepID=A0ABT3W888_9PROT|nr:glutathione-disulfide reductase [Bombella saccharophila]MCX5613843.1 glutathione-disulfide reductase [Bombella saccharophila]